MMNQMHNNFVNNSNSRITDYIRDNLVQVIENTQFHDNGQLTTVDRILYSICGTIVSLDGRPSDHVITSSGELPTIGRFDENRTVVQNNYIENPLYRDALNMSHWVLVSKRLREVGGVATLYLKDHNNDWYLVATVSNITVNVVKGTVSTLIDVLDSSPDEIYKGIKQALLMEHYSYRQKRASPFNLARNASKAAHQGY